MDILALRHLLPANDARLGFYAFGASVAALIYGLAGAAAEVQGQELLFKFGRHGRNSRQSLGEFARFMARESLLAVLIGSAIAVALAIVVPLFLKRYAVSLQLVGPLLAAGVILRWKTYPVIWLNADSRLLLSILAPLVGVVGIVLHVWAVHRFFADSLVGYSFCALTGYTMTSAFALTAAYRAAGAASVGLRQNARLVVANVPLVLYLVLWRLPPRHLPAGMALAALLVAVGCLWTYHRWLPGSVHATLCILVPHPLVGWFRGRFPKRPLA